MQTLTFESIRSIVYETSGISLSDAKQAMVSARLSKRLRALGLRDFDEYVEHIRRDHSGTELVKLVDAVSTNVTSFFREAGHFEFLHGVLSDLSADGQRTFRMWSAACSSGEEAYTLAMTAQAALVDDASADVRILGTDICTDVLAKARAATYPRHRALEIPYELRYRWVDPLPNDPQLFRISPEVTGIVSFARLNLAAPPLPLSGPFDVVLCRNVMIYFDRRVREQVVREMHRLIRPGGYLLVGHAESLNTIGDGFELVRPSIYRREP